MLADLAARQHGMVETRQLLARGVSRHQISRLVQASLLHPRHRGVYAVGHTVVSQRGLWMAAVLAVGEDARLCDHAGAALWGLCAARSLITVAAPKERRRPGLKVRVRRLAPDEVTVRDGIPVTTVARTILDLAAVAPIREVERVLREAEVQRLADATPLAVLLDRHAGRPGTPALRSILGRARDGRTRSELEEAFLAFLDERGLPRPKLNRFIAGKDRDCVYLDQRIVIELDGWWSHGKTRFHDDRGRDRRLLVAGFATVRVTFTHLEDEADELEGDLRALLGSTVGVHAQA